MRRRSLVATAVAGTLALLIAGPALAQGGPGGMMGDREWGMWWGGPWGRGADGMLDRIEGRLAFIKTELKITEAQAPAWNQLAESIRTAAKQHNERMKAAFSREERAKTLPERLEVHEQLVSARLEEIKQIKGNLTNLYAVLSEAQKKEADDIVLPMAGMMSGPMGGPMGRFHWWWRQ
jgi:LTXXQ motif family protein